jgi:hypothetical protein
MRGNNVFDSKSKAPRFIERVADCGNGLGWCVTAIGDYFEVGILFDRDVVCQPKRFYAPNGEWDKVQKELDRIKFSNGPKRIKLRK